MLNFIDYFSAKPYKHSVAWYTYDELGKRNFHFNCNDGIDNRIVYFDYYDKLQVLFNYLII